MEDVISSTRIPIKFWIPLNEVESGAIDQAKNVANLPFAYKHVAVMPDIHQGYGMPIGTVLAAENVVVPNAVGVDIGCGMIAMRTSIPFNEVSTEHLKKILGGSAEYKGGIRSFIPTGMSSRNKAVDECFMPAIEQFDQAYPIVSNRYEHARKQMGTLGGGNHFIELQAGSDGYLWAMIHSGSRNLGKRVADHYNKIAVNMNAQMHSLVPKHAQLAFLPIDTSAAVNYIDEMNFCVEFAELNRRYMMGEVSRAINDVFPWAQFDQAIECSHNFAALEHHFGKNVWVHRKGATRAREGERVIIPGSQGSKSYILSGLGSEQSFHSCSHGAGRTMSRSKAKHNLDFDAEVKAMEDKGILHTIRGKGQLDEAPGSYKDISKVIFRQQGLVLTEVELSPLACIKG